MSENNCDLLDRKRKKKKMDVVSTSSSDSDSSWSSSSSGSTSSSTSDFSSSSSIKSSESSGQAGVQSKKPKLSKTKAKTLKEKTPEEHRILVCYLTRKITKEHLHEIFSEFGTIKHIYLYVDEFKVFYGFAYIQFSTLEETKIAIRHMHKGQIDGREITCEPSSLSTADIYERFGNRDDSD